MAHLKKKSDLIAGIEVVERHGNLRRLQVTINGDPQQVLNRLQLDGITTVKLDGKPISNDQWTWSHIIEGNNLFLTVNTESQSPKITIEVGWGAGRNLQYPPHREAHTAVAA